MTNWVGNEEDAKLAERIRSGDTAAFSTIMHAYFSTAAEVAFRFVKSRDVAMDITQSIYAWIWERRANFNPTQSIKSYIIAAVRNKALNTLRQERVHEKYHGTDIHPSATEPNTGEFENRETIAALLAKLPDRRRQAVELRYLAQLSYAEVAEVMEISPGAAEQLVIRAMEELRKNIS